MTMTYRSRCICTDCECAAFSSFLVAQAVGALTLNNNFLDGFDMKYVGMFGIALVASAGVMLAAKHVSQVGAVLK